MQKQIPIKCDLLIGIAKTNAPSLLPSLRSSLQKLTEIRLRNIMFASCTPFFNRREIA
jgi:hypothetical protein